MPESNNRMNIFSGKKKKKKNIKNEKKYQTNLSEN